MPRDDSLLGSCTPDRFIFSSLGRNLPNFSRGLTLAGNLLFDILLVQVFFISFYARISYLIYARFFILFVHVFHVLFMDVFRCLVVSLI